MCNYKPCNVARQAVQALCRLHFKAGCGAQNKQKGENDIDQTNSCKKTVRLERASIWFGGWALYIQSKVHVQATRGLNTGSSCPSVCHKMSVRVLYIQRKHMHMNKWTTCLLITWLLVLFTCSLALSLMTETNWSLWMNCSKTAAFALLVNQWTPK